MDDLVVDLDHDIWRRGRNERGQLDNKYLRCHYPYVGPLAQFPRTFKNDLKIQTILKENFERDHNDLHPYLVRSDYIFFQTQEQADFFNGLLYIY